MTRGLILAIYIILFSTLNAQTQQLPKSDLVAKIDNKKEIFRITYNNDGYSFDGKLSWPLKTEHFFDFFSIFVSDKLFRR